jgi:tRNA pseudouridine13 synthase
METPYLTADLPGIGGQIKVRPEDFIVDELPLYEPSGNGIHCYTKIEKRGIPTLAAVNVFAKALGRRSMEVGYAGLKDAQAIARQTFSIEHEGHERIAALKLPNIKILGVTRHTNKLKIGHLAGNRFIIKIRRAEWSQPGGSVSEAQNRAAAVLERLAATGVPNFFGMQRFGMRRDNHLLGLYLLRDQSKEFLTRWLGEPDESVDHGSVLQARRHFANNNLELANAHWPGHLRDERRALSILARKPGQWNQAMRVVDIRLKRLLISALQAHLFNELLRMRLSDINKLLPGDLAWKHDIGAVFRVEADTLSIEQARCDAHEISPSGPMFGYRMTQPEGVPLEMENQVLASNELTLEAFQGPRAYKTKGSRRPMRFFPTEMHLSTGTDEVGPFLELKCALPPGCFATVLLGEIMKTDVPEQ